jgi:hypothetical protein
VNIRKVVAKLTLSLSLVAKKRPFWGMSLHAWQRGRPRSTMAGSDRQIRTLAFNIRPDSLHEFRPVPVGGTFGQGANRLSPRDVDSNLSQVA